MMMIRIKLNLFRHKTKDESGGYYIQTRIITSFVPGDRSKGDPFVIEIPLKQSDLDRIPEDPELALDDSVLFPYWLGDHEEN